jgi:chemotaxis protein methyltransferase CheR
VADELRDAPRLELAEFRQIRELVRRTCGIKLGDDARDTVQRRLCERLSALGLSGFDEYARTLGEGAPGAAEVERATELLATNETYFFRELSQLRAFESEVLPELQRAAAQRRALTVWSAGCSTGEEPYSIAILIARARSLAGWNVRVIGSDVSRRVLQVARAGVYRGASFRAMPAEYEGHFIDTPEGREVEPAVRGLCQFGQCNLLDASRVVMVGRVDAIFCRNVLIYFDEDARKRALAAFYERLSPGGFLLLGHSESLLLSESPFQLAQLGGEIMYRKPATRGGRGGA